MPRSPPHRRACPDDNDLARFVEHRLPWPRAREVEEHFDSCPVCRELVYVLVASEGEARS